MKRLSAEIVDFFHAQGCVLVSTVDKQGFPHSSCKGIVKIEPSGKVYLLDVYNGNTYENILRQARISLSAFDEHKFIGYCLKGKAVITAQEKLSKDILEAWDSRITSRLTQRLIKNLREEKGHISHPEAQLPRPKYLITVEVSEIIDLAPYHLRKGG
ncbi:MAG: pyridoxamine 5'-phosphate oxidase family protein [Candidatus Omnitrophota bacterium]|jgi:uncharacterized pyridoxamine 5'-phosphate oxidase family protein